MTVGTNPGWQSSRQASVARVAVFRVSTRHSTTGMLSSVAWSRQGAKKASM